MRRTNHALQFTGNRKNEIANFSRSKTFALKTDEGLGNVLLNALGLVHGDDGKHSIHMTPVMFLRPKSPGA